ncbi:MAG: InlB B-repeat-containing protein, partial [Paraeggerthella sp.]|nr:InlB B-repeat-containing protein [Paraeggerthella sp.]
MLEKMLDLKNTFEGKCLAVFMAVVMVLTMTNFAAFAEGGADGASAGSSAQKSAETIEASQDQQAVQDAVQHGADAAGSDSSASQAGPIVAPEVDEAVVTFEAEHAYVSVKDQILYAKTLTTELHKELKFAASADTGYRVSQVVARNSASENVPVQEIDGGYAIAAEHVDSTLVVTVNAEAVEAEQPAPAPETTPITGDSKVDTTGNSNAPAVSLSQTVGATTVSLEAPAGVLPAGVAMKVVPLGGEDVRQVAEEKASAEGKKLVGFVAVDVTLFDAAGNQIQPKGDVSLTLANADLKAGSTSLYHSEGNIADVEKVSDGTRATLSHLSPVLAVDAVSAALHTVTFTAEGNDPISKNVVEGEMCPEPATPVIPAGYVAFLGWYQKMEDGSLSSNRFDFASPVVADIELVAKFSDKWVVLFQDAAGKVVETQEVSNNQKAKQPEHTPVAPSGQEFDAWYLDGKPYNFNTPVTGNITLVPHFADTHYVHFVSKGSAVPSAIVRDGGTVPKPNDPTREGYDFQYWSTSEDGSSGAFNFDTQIKADTVLYGVWKGATVDYTLVYNFEHANIAGDAGTNTSNYSFSQQVTMRAQAGSTVSGDSLRASGLLNPNQYSDLAKYGYYAFGDTTQISGTGSTVINVYYKRTLYTVQFDLGSSSSRWMSFDGVLYSGGWNSSKYSFAAKYEQSIGSLWVSSKNATFWSNRNQGFAGWTGFGYSTFVSHRFTMTEDIIASANNDKVITATASWNTVSRSQVNYWLEVADPSNLPADAKQMPNGKYYSALNEYTQELLHSGSLSAKTIGGFSKKSDYNTDPVWEWDGSQWVSTYNFYYDRNAYTLSFNSMGGSFVLSKTVLYEAPMAQHEPDDPTREHYVFKGWYLDSDYMLPYDFGTATMPGSNVQLYAKWESSQYSAKFYTHEGDGTPVKTQGIAQGEYIKDPGVYIVGQGYEGLGEFLGWYWYLPGTDRLVAYSWETPVSGDVTLYGRWKTDGFSLTYDKGIGFGSVPVDTNSYALGVKAPVKDALLSASGKTFVGWQVDGSGRTYYPGNTIKMNGDTKLVARYVNPSLAVSLVFNANYGSNPATETWTAEKNDYVTLPDSMFDRAGYSFAVWNTKPDGSGRSYSVSEVLSLTGNTTLYAQWKESKPVTYTYTALTGGSVSSASETIAPVTGIASGSTASPDSGYRFDGWYDNAEASGNPISRDARFVPSKVDGVYAGGSYWARFVVDETQTYAVSYATDGNGTADPADNRGIQVLGTSGV